MQDRGTQGFPTQSTSRKGIQWSSTNLTLDGCGQCQLTAGNVSILTPCHSDLFAVSSLEQALGGAVPSKKG